MDFLSYAGRTHPGARRSANEDSICVQAPVFVVADGVGGSDRGELAAAVVTDSFATLAGRDDLTSDDVAATLDRAHAEVLQVQRRGGFNCASTASGVVGIAVGDSAYWVVFNVGDSRVYRMTGQARPLVQLSVDHSHVQEMVDAGVLDAAQAVNHPDRNVVTRAVGSADAFRPDYWLIPMVAGDRLMICSDGLLTDSPYQQVERILHGADTPQRAVEDLMELALRSGARDNVSVIVVDVIRPLVDSTLIRARLYDR